MAPQLHMLVDDGVVQDPLIRVHMVQLLMVYAVLSGVHRLQCAYVLSNHVRPCDLCISASHQWLLLLPRRCAYHVLCQKLLCDRHNLWELLPRVLAGHVNFEVCMSMLRSLLLPCHDC